jgi:hypothetical protein
MVVNCSRSKRRQVSLLSATQIFESFAVGLPQVPLWEPPAEPV